MLRSRDSATNKNQDVFAVDAKFGMVTIPVDKDSSGHETLWTKTIKK